MKKYIYLLLIVSLNFSFGQFQGPIDPISSGYGSDGTFTVNHIDILNDHYLLKPISIFYPEETNAPAPVIFYSHGYASSDTTFHIETLKHLASKGYAVVFVPYKTLGVTISERYQTLVDGFVKASRNNPSIIDTTRIGFFGQSFGGGATPSISYRIFTENNWGTNGKFIYCSAPWYSFELGTTDLSNFPTDCNMLTVLYDDDFTNDHRIGMDIFNNIAIDDSIKDCLMVYSDTINEYIYEADHTLPSQYTNNGEFDALDSYVTFRLLDALADYSFTGNLDGKDVALGNGSSLQLDMGGELKSLSHSNNPSPIYPESTYTNPCTDEINERSENCPNVVGIQNISNQNKVAVYPTLSNGEFSLSIGQSYSKLKVTILTSTGKYVSSFSDQTSFDLNHLSTGIYFVEVEIDGISYSEKIVLTEY